MSGGSAGCSVRARSAVLLLGIGALLLAGLPDAAAADADRVAPAQGEEEALDLLSSAARAARDRPWSGTQYVATWGTGSTSTRTLVLDHEPGTGTRVGAGSAATTVPPTALDEHLLGQLAARYALQVAGSQLCSGRLAHVVEARRGDGRVAGRFWLDRDTGLPLRQEVWDRQGRQLRSSAFLDLEVGAEPAPVGASPPADPGTGPSPSRLSAQAVAEGWSAPLRLPGGYVLFDTGRSRRAGADVLHLAYSDGLSTISVFSQPGTLGSAPGTGFRAEEVARSTVWVEPGMPERLVWGGRGQVFTMIADAGHADLRAAVAALPHDRAAREGPTARLLRGLARIGSWLDPRAG